MMDAIARLYLGRLLGSPRGRAFMLHFMVQAEEGDELGVFDTLLSRVDDPELNKLVRVHRDDETRHAAMLRECLQRNGVDPEPVPPELHVVARIGHHAGGTGESFVDGRATVMQMYLLLQVIEERGVRQFPKIANAMRPFDPESAAVIDRITRDEERHVKYAKAISRRYAPDDATLERELARFRAAERRAFEENGRALLAFSLSRGLDATRGLERLAWRLLISRNAPASFRPAAENGA
ncbi:ferritin-like domain-containing protein [Pendulispora rubella]|uniref:Ferritin-like domain-containing protein n=1 Tax=Pendulispora rubella TaxID=2741070 RepID=A0ABZ2LFH5_9BACT